MTQIKAFDAYLVGKELKRNQPSQETLQAQEQLLDSIIEARQEELKEKLKRDVAGSIGNTCSTDKKKKKQQPANSQKEITVKSGSKPVMVNRIGVTIKFSEIPQAEPADNKKVKLFFMDEDNSNYNAFINRKIWNKLVEKIEEIEKNEGEWTGHVSGKLKIENEQVNIVEAGLQVYDKNQKRMI